MNPHTAPHRNAASHELRFQPLRDEGHALSFPCNARGEVDLDALGATALLNYLRARTTIGRDYARPAVSPNDLH